jgi:hypothetical protein
MPTVRLGWFSTVGRMLGVSDLRLREVRLILLATGGRLLPINVR